jgi:hypothetical protein
MAGGGGKSTSTGTSEQSSQFSPELMSVFHLAEPTLRALSAQTTEALQTGGVNAQIPSVNSSVASAREAYSQSQQALRNNLAQSGLSGSSFAQEILGQNQMQAGQNIAAIPSTITNDFLAHGAPTVIGAGTSALSQAAGLNVSGGWTNTPSLWANILQGLQAAGGGGGSGGGGAASAAGQAAAGGSP